MRKYILGGLVIICVTTLGSVAFISGHDGVVGMGCINIIGLIVAYLIGTRNGRSNR